ncbi:MAG: hypothetical protein K2Z81_21760 [Cyanobacteria bacterium]|nr:hypothetical protein [Cyanobacteriota bacterium]
MPDQISRLMEAGSHYPVEPHMDESVASKLLRETQMVSTGVGEAFADVARDPISKSPELATAAGAGLGLKILQKAGSGGRVIAGAIGLGLACKMAYDEYYGDRWSLFGSALSDNWRSSENYLSNLDATKYSIGTLAVDSTVAVAGFHAGGARLGNTTLASEISSSLSSGLESLASPIQNMSRLGRVKASPEGFSPPSLSIHGKLLGHNSYVRLFEDLPGARAQASLLQSPGVEDLFWKIDAGVVNGRSTPHVPSTLGAEGRASLAARLDSFSREIHAGIKDGSGTAASAKLLTPEDRVSLITRLDSFSREIHAGIKDGSSTAASAKLLTPEGRVSLITRLDSFSQEIHAGIRRF